MASPFKALTLITGGMRSGKSRYALNLASSHPGRKCFIATAEALDEEMKIRILRHQKERGPDFFTLEEPLKLSQALSLAFRESDLVVVDCITLWVSNLLHPTSGPDEMPNQILAFLQTVELKKKPVIFVTNEVGLGLIGDNALSRRFSEELGKLNQKLAALCDEVILMISGIPTAIKKPVEEKR